MNCRLTDCHRYNVDKTWRCKNVGGYDQYRSRDVTGGLHQQLRIVAGLRLTQLPVERHVMSARRTCQPADSQLGRHRWRRAVAVVAPDLYRCCLDKHILHITVYDVMYSVMYSVGLHNWYNIYTPPTMPMCLIGVPLFCQSFNKVLSCVSSDGSRLNEKRRPNW